MKIVAIMGSPRKKFYTYQVVELFERTLKRIEPIEFEYIYLVDYAIPFCGGCMQCILKGERICKDAKIIAQIVDKLQQADGFIICSPSYVDNVSGLMKNFIDHLIYMVHRPILTNKYAMVVGVELGSGAKAVAKYLETTMIKMGIAVTGAYPAKVFMFQDASNEKRVEIMSQEFIDAIKTRAPPILKFNSVVYFKIMQALTQILKSRGYNLDFAHWEKNGWLTASYFRPAKIGFFASMMANFIQKMVKKGAGKSKTAGIQISS